MHKKNTQRWSKLISTAGILAVLFGGLVAQSVRAVSSNPTPVCVGPSCSVTFESTGDYYAWTPPTGARNITFDLMGGQGGRSGGQGGRVTGALINVPTMLYIYVGGAGQQGSSAAGGFNGGGTAGSGRGDEGSGGGATDLRTTTSTNDRIAVAAGGGGAGGFSGGAGGSGGGINGSSGTSGQGQGGAGATQSAGGNGGYPNGGSWGTNGDFGQGGAGGSSSTSGGGGGGGGYYGGGGGGADVDSCCSNAGGGGGGSSWSSSAQVNSVAHTVGYRAGAGLAILTYAMPPSATTFSAATNLTNANSVNFNLVFNEPVTGLTNADFSMTGSTTACSTVAVSGTGTTYTVTVSGCLVGTLKLILNSGSVMGSLSGPAVEKVASDVVIERTAPTLSVTTPNSATSATNLQYALTFSESVTGLTSADFSVTGTSCSLGTLAGSAASYTIQITGCADAANVQLSLLANSVSDLAANLGPLVAPTIAAVLIDRTAPIGTWSTPVATSYVSPSFELTMPEAITGLTSSDFLMIGAATQCVLSVTETISGVKFTIGTTGCSDGSVQILLNAGAYTDAFGNLGPAIVSASAVTTKVVQPTPTPTPSASAPVPAAPAESSSDSSASPIAGPAPQNPQPPLTNSIPQGETGPQTTIPAGTEIVAAGPVKKTYAFSTPVEEVVAPIMELQELPGQSLSQITVQNPTDPKPISVPGVNWFNIASLGFGGLAAIFGGIGAVKAARQMRTRRLVRKFA
jgi:hypothetical protein